MTRPTKFLLCAAALVIAVRALAAEPAADPDARVAEMLAAARDAYGVTRQSTCGANAEPGEIVVCARNERARQQVPSSTESNPSSREALRTGALTPPQLDRGSCRGQPGCVIGGWAPPPIYYIDLKAIPEPAEGSDADKIAKGEAAAR